MMLKNTITPMDEVLYATATPSIFQMSKHGTAEWGQQSTNDSLCDAPLPLPTAVLLIVLRFGLTFCYHSATEIPKRRAFETHSSATNEFGLIPSDSILIAGAHGRQICREEGHKCNRSVSRQKKTLTNFIAGAKSCELEQRQW